MKQESMFSWISGKQIHKMKLTAPRSQNEVYIEEDRDVRLVASKVTYVVTFVFMLSAALPDRLIYPEFFKTFVGARLLTCLFIALVFPLHFVSLGRKWVKVLPLLLGFILCATISWMIYKADGPDSPYYGALNLVILGFSVLLPWTYRETMLLWLGTLALYCTACWLNSQRLSMDGTFFIFLTGIACVISSYFSARARFRDFLLRSELDERNQELQEMDRVKTQFFSNVSHELRTPLTLIFSPIERLLNQAEELPGKVHETLLLVMQNSLRLLKLINDLLEVTRVDQPDFEMKMAHVELGSFLRGLFESTRHLGMAKGITLKVDGSKDHLAVKGDVTRLEKIFLNLYTNAVKFTKEGGTISVGWKEQGDHAVVTVEDSGIGIDREELPKIFDRFHQVDGSATRTYQGVGIGLSLVKDLVEKHNGSISVSSEPGQGTRFSVKFPLIDEATIETLKQEKSEAKLPPVEIDRLVGSTQANPIEDAFKSADRFFVNYEEADRELPELGTGDHTILVVDDEPDMRRFIVNLMAEDYTVLQAADGQTGLKLAQEKKPDLVLLDWMLPGINGLDICRELRKGDPDHEIKIIVITAKMEEESKIAALETGADDFLTKPFSTVEVKTRVSNLVRTGTLESNLKHRNVELETTLTQLKETEGQLVQSEKMNGLGNLAAGLLHEVNNPLNYCITALDYVTHSTPKDDEDAHDAFSDINEGLNRIKHIVSDLQVFAYPERNELRNFFPIAEAVESGLRLISHELTDIKLDQNIDEGCHVYGSKPQLIHIILNLVSNSAKAISEAGKKLDGHISINVSQQNDDVEIRVRDNGKGIKDQDLHRIFNPFFTTRDVGEGLGMGLSTCYTIVQNHQGTITAESEEGQWTEMVVTLPLNELEEKDECTDRELQKA